MKNSEKNLETNIQRWALFRSKEAAHLSALKSTSVSFCEAANGEINLRKENGQKSYYLHSEENPSLEAEKWFSALPLKVANAIYIYGVGLGYYYEAAKEWLRANPHRFLIFLEDDLEVIHRLFETERGSRLLHDPQVILHYWSDDESSYSVGIDKLLSHFSLHEYEITSLESYKQHRQRELSKLTDQIAFFCVLNKYETAEYSHFGLTFFNNFYRNMLYLPHSYSGDTLFGKFSGIPAIICGAGPSLGKNVEVLRHLKDRALIFAGGTALNTLNVHGILPHFGVGVDPNPDHFTRLALNQAYEVPFFYRTRMLHEALRMVHGDQLFITGAGGYTISEWFEKNLNIKKADIELTEGCNVLNFSLSIAHAMGCNPIICVGIDLAYSEGHSYAPGLISHPIHEYKSSFRTKHTSEELVLKRDIYGEPIHTLWKLIAEAIWYSTYADTNPDILMINATEGGIGFPNVENMPLATVAERYLKKQYDVSAWVHEEIQNSSLPPTVTPQKIQELMLELSESLHRCWLHYHEIYGELNNELNETTNFHDLRKKIVEKEQRIAQEPAYEYFLKIFNKAFLRVYGFEGIRIQGEEGQVPEKETEVKKIQFDASRFHFLKQAALVHSSLIQHTIAEYLERERRWQGISSEAHKELIQAEDLQSQSKEDSEVGDPFGEKQTAHYADGSLKSEQFYKKGLLHGPSTFYAADGTILAKSWFVEGKQQGKAWTYYPSGALHSLQHFKDGKSEGKQHYFHADGLPKTVLNYIENELEGEILLYYPHGKLKRSLHYAHGKRNGKERMWNEDGLLILEAEYKDDHPYGKAQRWHENGVLVKEVIYDEALHQCTVHRWDSSGQPIEEETFIQDDYFSKVAKHTEILTDSVEEIFKQINQVIPALANQIEEKKGPEKVTSKNDLQKDFEALKQKMEDLRGLSNELKAELNPEGNQEPIWKTPSAQREIEKQLENLKETLSKEINNIGKGLNDVLGQLFQKPPEDKP